MSSSSAQSPLRRAHSAPARRPQTNYSDTSVTMLSRPTTARFRLNTSRNASAIGSRRANTCDPHKTLQSPGSPSRRPLPVGDYALDYLIEAHPQLQNILEGPEQDPRDRKAAERRKARECYVEWLEKKKKETLEKKENYQREKSATLSQAALLEEKRKQKSEKAFEEWKERKKEEAKRKKAEARRMKALAEETARLQKEERIRKYMERTGREYYPEENDDIWDQSYTDVLSQSMNSKAANNKNQPFSNAGSGIFISFTRASIDAQSGFQESMAMSTAAAAAAASKQHHADQSSMRPKSAAVNRQYVTDNVLDLRQTLESMTINAPTLTEQAFRRD